MKIGFNGLNRCFDFGLVGPFRPKQTPSDPLEPKLAFWACRGGAVGGWEALPYKGGLPQGALVAQNLVDEGGDVA